MIIKTILTTLPLTLMSLLSKYCACKYIVYNNVLVKQETSDKNDNLWSALCVTCSYTSRHSDVLPTPSIRPPYAQR